MTHLTLDKLQKAIDIAMNPKRHNMNYVMFFSSLKKCNEFLKREVPNQELVTKEEWNSDKPIFRCGIQLEKSKRPEGYTIETRLS